ncbi:DUF6191 domain-containing protein [Rhodococcus marinonascens]|uniref:DUF6191 domain-containing protein n=1 Tax=Rhodococcus marinonascens TaxID=38311 RepID=UPI0014755C2D|nr:DUF6191 domain-containing protein [Rhodococcus marinonascens]
MILRQQYGGEGKGVELQTALVVVVVVVGMITIDRLGLWAEQKGWIFWRKGNGKRRGSAGSGMLGAMDELFAPSNQHSIEEIQSKKTTRLDASSGQGIDLSTGRVRISPTNNTSAGVDLDE